MNPSPPVGEGVPRGSRAHESDGETEARPAAAPPTRSEFVAQSVASVTAPLRGVSASLFAALAVVAAWSAQALAPALPGSATGIAGLIHITSFVAACTSQLVAAGGIALCLRALGALWPFPNLGVAFRLVIFPVTLGVIAITVTSAARPLDPELGRFVAVCAIVASAASAPLLWSSRRTRSAGIVLLLSALAATFDLSAYELARRASSANADSTGSVVAAIGLLLDVTAALWAFTWAAWRPKRLAMGLAAVFAFALAVVLVGQAGARHPTSGALVVLHRSLEALSQRPMLTLPSLLSHVSAVVPLTLAALLLVLPGRQPELRAALTLCLVGRTATGAPVAALLSVGAVLTSLGAWLYGALPAERARLPLVQSAANADNAPSTTTR